MTVVPGFDPARVRHSGGAPGFIAHFEVYPDVGYGTFAAGDTFYVNFQHLKARIPALFWPGDDRQLQYLVSIFGVPSR